MNNKPFDKYIVYYSPTRTKDSFGQKVETFAIYQKAFVAVDTYSGSEDVQAERKSWSGSISFTGHYISTIDTTYRILYEENYYAITDIEYLDRNRWMRITANKIIE